MNTRSYFYACFRRESSRICGETRIEDPLGEEQREADVRRVAQSGVFARHSERGGFSALERRYELATNRIYLAFHIYFLCTLLHEIFGHMVPVSRKDGAGDAEANAPQGDAAATPGEEQPQVDVKLTEQAAEGAAEEQPAADEVPYRTVFLGARFAIFTLRSNYIRNSNTLQLTGRTWSRQRRSRVSRRLGSRFTWRRRSSGARVGGSSFQSTKAHRTHWPFSCSASIPNGRRGMHCTVQYCCTLLLRHDESSVETQYTSSAFTIGINVQCRLYTVLYI